MKLRQEKSLAASIWVFIKTNPFKNADYSTTFSKIILDVPSNDSMEITRQALKVLKNIYKKGFNYKKAGVIVATLFLKTLNN